MSATDLPKSLQIPRRSAARGAWIDSMRLMLASPLRGLASLKLTVTLFSLAFLLIIIGTLAQYEKNMWQVMTDYFRTYIAWVDLYVFLPPSFFPNAPRLPGGFYFPGGKTLGILLMLNLIAAHAVRFRVQAKGESRWLGWLILGIGLVLTMVVILASSSRGGVQGQPLISFDTYWQVLRLVAVIAFAASWYFTFHHTPTNRLLVWLQRTATVVLAVICVVLLAWGGANRLSDASMRILWQLGQSLFVAAVVLAGCIVLFQKRAGVVVIHLGVALLMIGELIVSMLAVEQRITLVEGESTAFARELNALEVAIIDSSPADYEQVVAVPLSRLQALQQKPAGQRSLEIPGLPMRFELVDFMRNSQLDSIQEGDLNPATAGTGRHVIARPVRSAAGAEANATEDIAAAYVRISSTDQSDHDVYLLSQKLNDAEGITFGTPDQPEMVRVGDRSFTVALRSRRNYKPYTIKLLDVESKSYLGTNRPKDYSSYINLIDDQHHTRLSNYRIWMNNPLRYGGETFYQSGYHPIPGPNGTIAVEASTLSVVGNQGWMIPYVACGYVLLGMLFHFGNTLMRFLRRQSQEPTEASASPETHWWLPIGVVALFVIPIINAARPPIASDNTIDLESFRRVPVIFEGRVQPIDTLARTMLKAVSNKQSYRQVAGTEQPYQTPQGARQSAVSWLLAVASGTEEANEARVFRIENLAAQQLLGVEPRKGLTYSLAEIQKNMPAFSQAVTEAMNVKNTDPLRLTNDQRKIIQTANRLRTFLMLQSAFQPTDFPPLSTEGNTPEESEAQFRAFTEKAMQAMQRARAARESGIPLIVPGEQADDWLPFGSALDRAYLARLMQGSEPDERVVAWSQMLDAYGRGDANDFNKAVTTYRYRLDQRAPAEVSPAKIHFEVLFNRLQPFFWCMVAYVLAFVFIAVSWITWYRPLQSAAFWLVLAAFILHTMALVARMYISGRPPVTSLYSSAVFIGWGTVLFGLVVEGIFRLGVGHLLAAVAGFSTLLIAHYLGLDGDTFTVLQAVLDTQFWLATHVVTITLGYAATFVAGLFAIISIFSRWLPQQEETQRSLGKIIYGTLCFALFFSFVGTVLGGLWADDSWGRFWGWDPKENGALMIVLWNAIILHARWDGMIRERGTAVLAVLGNVVTAWSWFGVNELGIGLHAYGFREGTLFALGLFALSQFAIALLAIILPRPPLLSASGITKTS